MRSWLCRRASRAVTLTAVLAVAGTAAAQPGFVVEGGVYAAGAADLPLFPILSGLVSPAAVARAPAVNLGFYAGALARVHPRLAAVGGVRRLWPVDRRIDGDPDYRTFSAGTAPEYYAAAEIVLGPLGRMVRPAVRAGGVLTPAHFFELLVRFDGPALVVPSFTPQYRLRPTAGGVLSIGRRFGVRISADAFRVDGAWTARSDVGLFTAF